MIPLGELERLCAEATQERGEVYEDGGVWAIGGIMFTGGYDGWFMGGFDEKADAELAAACDPPTVAALTRAARILDEVQWRGYLNTCVTCGYAPHQGHAAHCSLAAALAPFVASPPAPPTEEQP